MTKLRGSSDGIPGGSSAGAAPLVSVFILNWNRRDELVAAVESALQQTYSPVEVLVVDNGSTDGSARAVRERFPAVRVVELDRNYGCPGGRNRGVPHCRGEMILFMDNDAVLHERAVERALEAIRRDSRIAVVSGAVKYFNDAREVDTRCPLPAAEESYFCGHFQGGVSLHRKHAFLAAGGFPDHYMYGGEEEYLGYVLLDLGHLILRDPGVILWHKRAISSRQEAINFARDQTNAMETHVRLWPPELLGLYIVRSVPAYLRRAFRKGMMRSLLPIWPRMWLRSLARGARSRRPIRRETLQASCELRWRRTRDPDQVFVQDMPYWRFLVRFLAESCTRM